MKSDQTLRILLVEDNQSDVELAERELKKEGIRYELKKIDSKEELLDELSQFYPDIVITDYSLPGFDGMQVINIVRDQNQLLPVVVLTGSMNEETAVSCMKSGAWDYVLKEHITRLPFVVKDAIQKKNNIAEKERIEQELIYREKLFSTLISNMLDGMVIIDWDGTILFSNNAALKIVGFSEQDSFIGSNIFSLIPDDDKEKIMHDLQLVKEDRGGFIRSYRINTSAGEARFIEALGSKILFQGKEADLVTFRDVTEKKKAEEMLQEKTENLTERIKELQCIYAVAKLVMKEETPTRDVIRLIADTLSQSFRFPKKTCVRITCNDLVYETENFNETSCTIYTDINLENESLGKIEVYYLDESICDEIDPFIEEEIRMVENVAGHVAHFVERKRIRKELRKVYNLFKDTQEVSKVGGWEYDFKKNTVTWTDEAYRIFGVDSNFDLNDADAIYSFFVASHKDRMIELTNKAIQIGEQFDEELEVKSLDGIQKWVRVIGKPVTEYGKRVRLIGNIMDITDRKLLEQQILQTQKLESVGKLAGGVAHDLNNVLGAILGHADLGRRKITSEHPLYDRMNKILDLTERGAQITRQLLAFSRRQDIEPKNVNINTLISDILKLIGKTLGENININAEFDNDISTVSVDPGQMDQVIMNLCINARDAMPDGGDLTISTRNIEIDDDYARYHVDAKPGRYIVVSVSDTGTGIPKEELSKIFDPFYTTKEADKGTGLGLSVVHGIVGQHNGFITVYSEIEVGTTFNIYLPAVEGKPEVSVSEKMKELPGGRGTILVVEDDDEILNMIITLLEHQGYTVLHAKDGQEGYEKFTEKKNEIELVVSDVVMPNVSGREMYDRIRTESPKTPVLFMSGYTADLLSKQFVTQEGVDFISKPFSAYDFGKKVSEIINKE